MRLKISVLFCKAIVNDVYLLQNKGVKIIEMNRIEQFYNMLHLKFENGSTARRKHGKK